MIGEMLQNILGLAQNPAQAVLQSAGVTPGTPGPATPYAPAAPTTIAGPPAMATGGPGAGGAGMPGAAPAAPPPIGGPDTPPDLSRMYMDLVSRREANSHLMSGLAMIGAGLSRNPSDRTNLMQYAMHLSGQGDSDPSSVVGNLMKLQEAARASNNRLAMEKAIPELAKKYKIDETALKALSDAGMLPKFIADQEGKDKRQFISRPDGTVLAVNPYDPNDNQTLGQPVAEPMVINNPDGTQTIIDKNQLRTNLGPNAAPAAAPPAAPPAPAPASEGGAAVTPAAAESGGDQATPAAPPPVTPPAAPAPQANNGLRSITIGTPNPDKAATQADKDRMKEYSSKAEAAQDTRGKLYMLEQAYKRSGDKIHFGPGGEAMFNAMAALPPSVAATFGWTPEVLADASTIYKITRDMVPGYVHAISPRGTNLDVSLGKESVPSLSLPKSGFEQRIKQINQQLDKTIATHKAATDYYGKPDFQKQMDSWHEAHPPSEFMTGGPPKGSVGSKQINGKTYYKMPDGSWDDGN